MRTEREDLVEMRDGRLHDRPLGDLLGDLARQGQALVRDELRLAKADLREELHKIQGAGAMLGGGGAAVHAALFFLGLTLTFAGATFLPAWLSAAIVTVIFAVVGGALIGAGRSALKEARPGRAAEHLREDGRWLRETMQHVKSSRGAAASRSSRARYPDA